ncbi:hypothetical protein BDEG_28149 [Batrachochytrium dendrobatidis JEL423]|uniref:F-box domain-containing protein n=1 Tax=Batrachochytrium dendrobatidis (strain JEL423) TaxID=403673 RepID=A0A177WZ65_BATDL|nr:hypothetical protein BDEG_28149 [Batrachochytrium dendrobatidis JEL423]
MHDDHERFIATQTQLQSVPSTSAATNTSAIPIRVVGQSSTSKKFRALLVCIKWYSQTFQNDSIPNELWNALFQTVLIFVAAKSGRELLLSHDGALANIQQCAQYNLPSDISLSVPNCAIRSALESPLSSQNMQSGPNIPSIQSGMDVEQTFVQYADSLADAKKCKNTAIFADGTALSNQSLSASRLRFQESQHMDSSKFGSSALAHQLCFIYRLPTELLCFILSKLAFDQPSLSAASRTSHRMFAVGARIIYKNPHISTSKSLSQFTRVLHASTFGYMNSHKSNQSSIPILTTWLPYSAMVKKITFEPDLHGSLVPNSTEPHIEGIDNVRAVHSSIFRHLVHQQETQNTGIPAVLPRSQNQGLCPYLMEIEDRGVENTQSTGRFVDIMKESSTALSTVWQRVPSTSFTLTLLIRSCRRWVFLMPEWRGFDFSPHKAYGVITFLLDSLQTASQPIWHNLESDLVRFIRPMLISKCRSALSSISSTLLLQVQFMTLSAQRLLDCYTMIYYKALSIAQSLSVTQLVEIMQGGAKQTTGKSALMLTESLTSLPGESLSAVLSRDHNGVDHGTDTQHADEEDTGAQAVPLFELHNVSAFSLDTTQEDGFFDGDDALSNEDLDNHGSRILDSSTNLDTGIPSEKNISAAIAIHTAVAVLLRIQLPTNASVPTTAMITNLREAVSTFPPTPVNGETVEMLQHASGIEYDIFEPGGHEISRWISWLKQIETWHVASRQMEPVKSLLRQSMIKIDCLRNVQRTFGLNFMD